MRLNLKEFEKQLEAVKKLPASDARTALMDNLKTAEVFEKDDKGVETPVNVKIMGDEPPPATAVQKTTTVDEEAIKRLAADAGKTAGEAAVKAAQAANPIKPGIPAGSSDKKFIIPVTVKRVGALKNFTRPDVGGLNPEERAYRFGMWGLAAMGNDKAKAFCAEHGIGLNFIESKTAHAEGVNSLGGFLVPEEFGRDLIDLRERFGVARRILRVVPMISDTRTDPRRVSGLTPYFVAENAAGTESNKTWDQVRLTAKDLMVLSRMSNQLSADAVINIGDDLAGEIAYAFSLKEDQCAFLGDGSATYGGIVGFSSKLTTINGVDDGGGIVLASGNLFSEFTLADFNRVVGRIPQYADTANAVWTAHRSFYYGTMQRLELAAGGVTAMEVAQGDRRPRPLFLGYPVEFVQVMPSADVNSQIAATFGDHALAASFGDRQQDSIAFSDSATIGGESVFERNQIAIRGTERFDINVHDVGTATEAGPVVGLMSAAS